MNKKFWLIFLIFGMAGLLFVIDRGSGVGELAVSAGVVPHHLLAEDMIEEFFDELAERSDPEQIIVLSPDHFGVGSMVGDGFVTLGEETELFHGLRTDRDLIGELAAEHRLIFSDQAVEFDHGISDLMPYIADRFPESRIVPFLVPLGRSQEEMIALASSLDEFAGDRAVVVASVDFSHYLTPSAADFHDVKSLRVLLRLEEDKFSGLEVDSWQSLLAARWFAGLRGKEYPEVLRQANSADYLPPEVLRDTTSYLTVLFTEGDSGKVLNSKEYNVSTALFAGLIDFPHLSSEPVRRRQTYPLERVSQLLRGVDTVIGSGVISVEGSFGGTQEGFYRDIGKLLNWSYFDRVILKGDDRELKTSIGSLETGNVEFWGITKTEPIVLVNESSPDVFGVLALSDPDKMTSKIKDRIADRPDLFRVAIIYEELDERPNEVTVEAARNLIEAGIDVVIRQGPESELRVESYKDGLIFSHLGYFLPVNKGANSWALGLELYRDKARWRLFPITEKKNRSELVIDHKDRKQLLAEVAQRSSGQLRQDVLNGIIELYY